MMTRSGYLRGEARLFLCLGMAALICLVALGGGGALADSRPAIASPAVIAPDVYLNVASPVIEPGQIGKVMVRIRNVRKLSAFEYKVTFDPSVLEVVDANLDKAGVQIDGATIFGSRTVFEGANQADNGLGVVHYGLTLVGEDPVTTAYAHLGTITFRAKTAQNSDIGFLLEGSFLSDENGWPIVAEWHPARILGDANSVFVPLALKNAH